MSIRAARIEDAAFLAAGNVAMALESEHKQLDPATVTRGVQAVLADPARGRYFIAERGGQPVGQLMVTYEWSDWRNGNFWWIQSVYVLPEARRLGVSAGCSATSSSSRRSTRPCAASACTSSAKTPGLRRPTGTAARGRRLCRDGSGLFRRRPGGARNENA